MPARRRDPVSVPRTFHSSGRPHRHDYGIDDSISRAGYFSNAVLDDTDAAAAYSRARDYDLLRNTQSAIRHTSPESSSSRVGRASTRYQSLPPVADRSSPTTSSRLSISPSTFSRSSALVASQRLTDLRKSLESPPPSSLLSTKINTFLRGYSLPAGARPSSSSLVSYKSYLDSAAPPPPRPIHDSKSIVSYKSHLSDPAISSPFSTRSSSRLYRGYVPSSLSSSSLPLHRSSSLPRYNISLKGDDDQEDYDYGGGSDDYDDEEEYELPSYRRKYKVVHGRQALPTRPSSTLYYSSGAYGDSDDDDDAYSVCLEDRGTYYDYPRPSGLSSLTLSSYEGPHDGSYESDMAEMYEYVPFGPSRQGILELTQHRPTTSDRIEILDEDDEDDDDYNGVESSSRSFYPSPSPSTLLTFPSASSSYSSPSIPSVSLFPKPSSDFTSPSSSPISSFANNTLFDSVLSSTAARARAALKDCQQLSDYRNASLVLSVEGSAMSPDGRDKYGFRYYPPPIPIKGSGVGLDERILGISPKPSTSPADSFFSDYLNRLKSLRSEINDREESRAASGSGSGRSVVSVPRPLPSYDHSTVHMPVHIAGRSHSVPVSSYRSPADTRGLSHRVDVFPLLESSTSLGKDKLQLPVYRSGGDTDKLSMLEKINIKAATETHTSPRTAVASMRARASSVPPKVQARPARLHQQLVNRPKVAPSIIFMSKPPVASPLNTARYASTPVAQPGEMPWRVRASSVQPEVRFRRAGSMPPPRPLSYHQGVYEPVPQQPLGTEGLRAHMSPVVMRRGRAGSVPPPRPRSSYVRESLSPPRLIRAGSVHTLRPRSYYEPVEKQAVGTEGLRASRLPPLSRTSRAQSVSRLPPRRPLDFGVDEVELERSLSKSKQKAEEKKLPRGFASRATSEPPRFIAPSTTYPTIADAQLRSRVRQLFTRRGQVNPIMSSRAVSVAPLYVPSSVAKAAIIGSKMEEGGKGKRKPRPLYHVEKSREPSTESSQKSAIYYESPIQYGGLQSSRPPLPKPTDRKAIRTIDGFTKPKNVMSWESSSRGTRYSQITSSRSITPQPPRKQVGPPVRAHLYYRPAPPAIYVPPRRFSVPKMSPVPPVSIRLEPRPIRKTMSIASMESNAGVSSSVKIPDYYYAGGDPNNAPMSETRRRLRRTLNKTRTSP